MEVRGLTSRFLLIQSPVHLRLTALRPRQIRQEYVSDGSVNVHVRGDSDVVFKVVVNFISAWAYRAVNRY